MQKKKHMQFRILPKWEMKVRWATERELMAPATAEVLRSLIADYGKDPMAVMSVILVKRNDCIVTLDRAGVPLREDAQNLRSSLLRVSWMYLKPL